MKKRCGSKATQNQIQTRRPAKGGGFFVFTDREIYFAILADAVHYQDPFEMSVPTIISTQIVVPIACLGMVLIFSAPLWRKASPGYSKDREVRREAALADPPQLASSDSISPARTKFRFRSARPWPTIEETSELARTTIIPVIDLPPDQPLPERIARINELIRAAGVESDRLRVIIKSGDPALQWRFREEMRIRQIPVAVALKYVTGSTKLRYHIRENGIVELTTLQDPDTTLPAAEPESRKGDPDGSQENDPFAEPVAPPEARRNQ